jgi:transposase-like protein
MAMPPTPEDRLRKMLSLAGLSLKPAYCIKDVARLLDVSPNAIYRMIERGDLDALRLSKKGIRKKAHLRVDFTALVEFIAIQLDEG